jgi:hypothetical protein
LWKSWEGRHGRKSDTRRDLATGPPLRGTFIVGVLEKHLADLTHLLEGAGVINVEALLPVGPLNPLHTGIFVGAMWRTHVRPNPQA